VSEEYFDLKGTDAREYGIMRSIITIFFAKYN
jgi:hypothetical protein